MSRIAAVLLRGALLGAGLGMLAPGWARVTAPPRGIVLPPSDRVFPGVGPGAAAANGYCLMCHSYGMVATQPRLDDAQWLAEIDKMREAYKAPVPPAEVPVIAAYLRALQRTPTTFDGAHG